MPASPLAAPFVALLHAVTPDSCSGNKSDIFYYNNENN